MLLRAALRSLRSCQTIPRPIVLQPSVRAYAKAGNPKPGANFRPPPHSSSSVVSPKHVSPTSRAPSSTTISSETPAVQQNPPSQEKLDQEAVDAMPSPAESGSKSAIGAQPEDLETEKHTLPREPPTLDPPEAPRGDAEQQIPLHDLTKGLPSTLDAELEAASKKQDGPEAAEQGQGAKPSGRGKGDRPVRDYTTSAERRRNRMMGWTAALFGVAVLASPVWLGRNWETAEEERQHPNAPNGWGIGLFANRLRSRMTSTLDYYSEPAFEKLLPDPDPMYERPYTLILSLEDLLIHSEWTRDHGWRMAKRPGLDYFLRYLSLYYEIVIFTSVSSMIAGPALQKLDPFGMVIFRLFREATRYENGEYIKDLSYLNRPLNKIISIDTDPAHVQAQPENAIILPRWKGDPNDSELIALIPFLECAAAMELPDTRKVLASFEGKHIPTEWAKREAEMRKRLNDENAEKRKKQPRRSGVGFLGSSLGIQGSPMQLPPGEMSMSEAAERGLTMHDVIRQRGQKSYEALEKEIRDNAEEWMKQLKEEDEKMKEETMKGFKQGLSGWFGPSTAPSNAGVGAKEGKDEKK